MSKTAKARGKRILRQVLEMLLLGAAFWAVELAAAWFTPTVVHVVVPADASESEREKIIDDALCWAEIERLGLAEPDPFVRHRVVANLQIIEGESLVPETEAEWRELYARAERLGMFRRDPLLSAYLLGRLRRRLMGWAPDGEAPMDPSPDIQTESVNETHIAYDHVFLTEGDGSSELAELRSGGDVESDPLLDHHAQVEGPLHLERERWGREAGHALAESPIGEWTGPHRSMYGVHLLRVRERAEVTLDRRLINPADETALRRGLESLRERYHVDVVSS